MHAKYKVCISNGSKVMDKVKGFFLPQSDRQTESQAGQKLDPSKFHSRGIKMKVLSTSILFQNLWPRLQFLKIRSNFKVKVKKILYVVKSIVTKNEHIQYESSILIHKL